MTNDSLASIAIFTVIVSLLGSVKLASAQYPAGVNPAAVPTVASEVARPCVLLRNDNVLFGVASQRGQYVIVQRSEDNEIRLPRQEVACWANSLRDLYRYRVDHRQQRDIAAHLKDARWCLRYDLFDLAHDEIQAVLAIDSRSEEAKRLQRQLQRILSPPSYSRPPEPAPIVQPVGYDDQQTDLGDVDLATLSSFAGDVQPMLINRCGQCHSHTTDRHWQLQIPASGTRASSRMTRENLTATLAFINRSVLEESELWVKAVTPHGGVPARLDPRRAKAMGGLQNWLDSIARLPSANAANGLENANDSVPQMPSPESQSPESQSPEADQARALETWLNDRPADPETPARLPQVANPFDPDLFNRRYHPQ